MTECSMEVVSVEQENRLKALRKQRRLTQITVQMETGIEQTLISKYERGERVPPTESLVILAKYYHTSMDYIMGLTDMEKPYPPVKGTQ
ncbi:helix-turn-helix domain-containing protein [Acutalibacter caecimuris]|uniref:helix-turn-helix domain-containing protein n=1 Tax=Acutalibacter caecimuris TaxID=3093657 RepID=UPI002AC99EA6|nr:helix-turn-helix transcriptional regulator [Acutalibacter sp. M00118]